MSEMRSPVAQFAGLARVAELLPRLHEGPGIIMPGDREDGIPVITYKKSDVVALHITGVPGIEIVYASGGYDLWVDGDLEAPDLDLTGAVNAIRDLWAIRYEPAGPGQPHGCDHTCRYHLPAHRPVSREVE